MIKFHLAKLLVEKGLNQKDLCTKADIRPGTINAYYHNFIKRIEIKDLNKICETLDCSLSELAEYIPDKK